jgi:inosine/xanthosine triphosphate pyrophosphatase family protein
MAQRDRPRPARHQRLRPAGEKRSSAELTAEEKDAASHRGRALRALLPHLSALGA